jgi:hypothetical protein
LAVELTAAFERAGLLIVHSDRDYELTHRGELFFGKWKIDVHSLRHLRRGFAKRCLDWTERRDHLAGALGAAICQKLMEFRWITRDKHSRTVHVSQAGRQQLSRVLDLPGI